MPEIHPTAILDGKISLADDVVIGPHCVLTGDITLGGGTTLIGNCYLTGTLCVQSYVPERYFYHQSRDPVHIDHWGN